MKHELTDVLGMLRCLARGVQGITAAAGRHLDIIAVLSQS